jgi:heme export protein D (CcmD)
MKKKFKPISFIILFLQTLMANAQNGEQATDLMRSNGMIFVVIGVLVIIFLGLFIYMLLIERKLSKIEKNINNS